jgi:hypothetical protein
MKKQHTYTLPLNYRLTREIENARKPYVGKFRNIAKEQEVGRTRARLKSTSRKPVTLPKVSLE